MLPIERENGVPEEDRRGEERRVHTAQGERGREREREREREERSVCTTEEQRGKRRTRRP